MAVSSVSYTKTPQAGDDSYIWTEDQLVASGLYSHEYDSLISRDRNVLKLDVMANDLGGKAKSLYSVDDGGSGALSDLLTRDVSTVWQNFDNYSIRIASGRIEVDISKLIQQAGGDPSTGIDSLRAGQNINTSFVYAIQMGNGTISYATVTLQIQGYNDAATISSSNSEDTIVIEAGGTNNATIGDATASGKLTVNDVDAGENKFQNPQTTQLEGQYGTFTFNAETGDWTYTLDEAKANTMVQGEVHEEVLTVTSIDGTARVCRILCKRTIPPGRKPICP